jgi:hypothetical protein
MLRSCKLRWLWPFESFNDGQRAAYNGVIDAYVAHHTKVIFIMAPVERVRPTPKT